MKYRDLAMLGLYAETSMHCGDEGSSGFIDMPVQREKHTEYPVIPGSTLKGVLRAEYHDDKGESGAAAVFGSKDGKGGICVADGMLVAFPVRSLLEPFFWVTCPYALERFARIAARYGVAAPAVPAIADDNALVCRGAARDISLEDSLVSAQPGLPEGIVNSVSALLPSDEAFNYVREALNTRLLAVSDLVFRDLVKTATDVVTRVRIDQEKGTVARGALFNQELVPSDAIFVSSLRGRSDADVDAYFKWFGGHKLIRIGADETIGRGITHVSLKNGGMN
ncbi:MAG: type III-B CRISPR module RAMP protein Cmr4 [bacterium]|jgi:CRISPR-associated protein Cmr4